MKLSNFPTLNFCSRIVSKIALNQQESDCLICREMGPEVSPDSKLDYSSS